MQIALRALLLTDVIALWKAFDIKDIDRTWQAIEDAVFTIVREHRLTSYAISQRYAELFRAAERVLGAAPLPEPMKAGWETPAAVSLRVTGPIGAKQLVARNVPPVQAAQTALVRVSGAATRIVLDGGREALGGFVRADKQTIGWARVTDGDPCAFCAMLASRGPVYNTDVEFEAHDHDACTLEPVYRKSSKWPGIGRDLQSQWNEVTRGIHGMEAQQAAWRNYWESRG